MSNATKAATTDVTQIFDSAVSAFGDTMKASVKAQEEMLKFWSGALQNNGALGEWQKRSKAIVDRTTPAVQKSAEEWIKLVEQNYKRSVDLLKKAIETEGHGSVSEIPAKTQKAWQSILELVRDNAQATAQANVRLVELWADILKKNLEQGEAFVASAAKGK